MANIKSISANLLLLVFGAVLAFIVLEIGLRILDPFQFRVRGDEITLPSNVRYVTTNNFADKLDKTIIHSKNSLGFRGNEPPDEIENRLSIIAVGGSTTESRFQSDDKEWVSLLGQQLGQYFSPVWINNAGLDGHSTFGHMILVRDLISPIRAKVVLFLVGINEVGRGEMIIDERKYQDKVQTNSPTLLILSIANKSEVLTLAINMLRYFKAKRAGLTHNTQLDLHDTIASSFKISELERQRILAEHKKIYLPEYAKRLEKLLQITRSAGSVPVLITQPALYGPFVDDVTGIDLGHIPVTGDMDGSLAWEVLEMYNAVSRSMADKHGLLLIDLATRMPKSSSMYYDMIHFTNKGAELVASNVFQALCPWLTEQYPDHITSQCPASGN